MNFKKFFVFIYLIFFHVVCFAKAIELDKVADYSIIPQSAFLIKNKLYIDYGKNNIFLTLKINKKNKHQNEIKRLKLDADKPKEKEKQAVIIIKDNDYKKVANEIAAEFDIKQGEQLKYYYQNEFGEFFFSDRFYVDKKLKKDNKKTPNDKLVAEQIFSYIITILNKYYNENKYFLLVAENLETISYLYVDTEKEFVIPLVLPPFKTESVSTVNKSKYLYDFIIKSHLFPVIKSPFTSTYRLFSTFTSSMVSFSPVYIEERLQNYKDTVDTSEELDVESFNKFLDEEVGTKQYKARLKYFIDGEEFFDDFVESAKKALHSIFIQTYIFKTDEFSVKFADFLKERNNENIDVRIIIDSVGAGENKSKQEDVLFRKSNMPESIKKYLKENSNVKVRIHPNTWLNFDHRKMFIIDRKKVYVGGMNIANEYRYTWHDLMVSIEGPLASVLVKNFYKSWSFAGAGGDFAVAYRSIFTKSKRNINKAEPDMIDVRLLYTAPTDYQIYDAQLEAARRAKKRIYIENPYMNEKTISEELVNAAKRGVDVRVIIPETSDIVVSEKLNLKTARYLIQNGVKVYAYPKMLHSKAAVFDSWACLGSANMNRLSLFSNREIDIAFYDKTMVDELVEKLFMKDFAISHMYKDDAYIPWYYYLL